MLLVRMIYMNYWIFFCCFITWRKGSGCLVVCHWRLHMNCWFLMVTYCWQGWLLIARSNITIWSHKVQRSRSGCCGTGRHIMLWIKLWREIMKSRMWSCWRTVGRMGCCRSLVVCLRSCWWLVCCSWSYWWLVRCVGDFCRLCWLMIR